MMFDAPLTLQILIFAAVFSACQAAWGLMSVGRTRKAVNRRLASVERGLALGELIVELRKQRGLNEDGAGRLAWRWLADLIVRSGVVYQPRRWAVIVGAIGLGVGLIGFLPTHNLLVAILAGAGAAVLDRCST